MLFKRQILFSTFFIYSCALSEINKCNMTYMYGFPLYQVPTNYITTQKSILRLINIITNLCRHFPSKKPRFKGKPILFLPGNCGSYKQVRSIASVTMDKIATSSKYRLLYDFYSIDYNEEKSAFSGLMLKMQTEYSSYALGHLLKLYKNNDAVPNKLTIIGHSLGGTIARGMLMDEKIDHRQIDLIITLATPHKMPINNEWSNVTDEVKMRERVAVLWTTGADIQVKIKIPRASRKFFIYSHQPHTLKVIAWDPAALTYYESVHSFWTLNSLENSTFTLPPILSLAGGSRDRLVPTDYVQFERPNAFRQDFQYSTTHLVDVWLSNDHLSIVWCNQLMRLLSRILLRLPRLGKDAVKEMVESQLEGNFQRDTVNYNSSKIKNLKNLNNGAIFELEATKIPLLFKAKTSSFPKAIRIADLSAIASICVYMEGVESLKETVVIDASFKHHVNIEMKRIPPTRLRRYVVKIEAVQHAHPQQNNQTPNPLEIFVLPPLNLIANSIVLADRCGSHKYDTNEGNYYWLTKSRKIEHQAIHEYTLPWLTEIWQGYHVILMAESKCKSQRMVTMTLSVDWFKENRYWTRTEDASKIEFAVFEADIFLQSLPLNKFYKPTPAPLLTLTLNPQCKYEIIFKLSPKIILRQLLLYQNYYIIKAIILFYLIELTLSANAITKYVQISHTNNLMSQYPITSFLHFLAYFVFSLLTKKPLISGDNLHPRSVINQLLLCILAQFVAVCLHVALRALLTLSFWLGHRIYIKSPKKLEDKKGYSWPRVLTSKVAVVCALIVTFNYVWAPYISWSLHFFLVYIVIFPLLNAKCLTRFQLFGVYINYFTALLCLIASLMILHTHTFIYLTHNLTYPSIGVSLMFALFPLYQYPWYWVIFKCVLLSLMLPQILIPNWCIEASYICPLARLFKNYYFTVWLTPFVNAAIIFYLPRTLAYDLTLLIELNLIIITCHVIFIIYDILHRPKVKAN